MAGSDLALPQGYELQEYRIESTLGVGGFGLTYLATDTNLNVKIALKEYLPGDLARRDADRSIAPKSEDAVETFKWGLERFLDESRTLASFKHPNIVRVMRFFQANKTAYMVMEFVSGDQLSDWVKARRPVDEASLRGMLLPLLDGLGVVHASGFLHRDIKPGNIFMRGDGSPVLLDFGSARATGGELTAIVTPGYAPLEQYHTTGHQGPWSDIYALGGVLYWLVTGNKPVDAAARIRTDPMPPAAQVGDRNRYSEALLTSIDWMLMPSEDQRPQNVDEIKAVLQGNQEATKRVSEITQRLSQATQRVDTTASSQPVTASAGGLTGVTLDREVLKRIEVELTKHLGPIAPVAVRSAAKKSLSISQLVEMVARDIDDDVVRTQFIKRFANSDTSRPVPQPSQPSRPAGQTGQTGQTRQTGQTGQTGQTQVATMLAVQRFDAAIISTAEAALSKHLGPLARIVVKRAAMKARDESELYLLIADEIEDKDERKAFIRKAVANK
ncbi:MAG: serine/threonine protein kinase [Burkholderiales bacterium]